MASTSSPAPRRSRSSTTSGLGLIDRVLLNVVPTVFGSGRPFLATGPLDAPIMLGGPVRTVQGDRVTHLLCDVVRG